MNTPSHGLLAAAAACGIAVIVFGSAVVRAVSVPPLVLDDGGMPLMDDRAGAGAVRPAGFGTDDLSDVLDSDPFQPDRQRPPERYRLPGDVDPPPPPPPPPPPAIPDFRVAGTAVTPDGGFAVMRVGDGPQRVITVGEYLGGYQLDRVSAGVVVMKNEEREVSVLVPGPSSQIATAPATTGRTMPMPQREVPVQQRGRQQQLTPEQARRMQEILDRARADGAPPQMLQAIQQLIQQRGIENFMDRDFVIEGGNMRIMQRRPDTTGVSMRQQPDPSQER